MSSVLTFARPGLDRCIRISLAGLVLFLASTAFRFMRPVFGFLCFKVSSIAGCLE